MAGRVIFRDRATSSSDPNRRLDEFENRITQLAGDGERAFDTGGKWEVAHVSSNVAAKPWQLMLCDPRTAAFTVVLPSPSGIALSQIEVKNDTSSANAVTVIVASSGTIDGQSSVVLSAPRQSKIFRSDGREWKELRFAVSSFVTGSDAAMTALAGQVIFVPTLTAARTITLPATPTLGDQISISAAPNAHRYNVTISGNGKNIGQFTGSDTTFVLTQAYAAVTLIYDGSEWRPF